eukprot:TRINITY_DN4571_c0_g2_i2.p1 TRINITY_DN4571_c0_g2~~TRINITY_DN4571_c0_g2_i2.p1  ORF type:complete len:1958 (+),score=649.53 TRINITY_DN4571_c0_g2_i2:78-5951(+)
MPPPAAAFQHAFTGALADLQKIAIKAKDIDAYDRKRGATLVYTAARCGHLAVVKYLVGLGADVKKRHKENGSTPLHSAAYGGHPDVIAFLLECDADREAKNKYGETALDNATSPEEGVAEDKQRKCCELLQGDVAMSESDESDEDDDEGSAAAEEPAAPAVAPPAVTGDEYLARVQGAGTFAEREAAATAARERENYDRRLFAMQRDSWEVPELADPYRPLVKVFHEGTGAARLLHGKEFPEEKALPFVFPAARATPRPAPGTPLTVATQREFETNFHNAFGYNILQFLNWDNVVAAGGAVAGCLRPVPAEAGASLLEKRQYYQDELLCSSDLDLFLYALSEEAANKKLLEIYDAVCQACPFEVICFRSAHAVTMVSQFPYRHVQVVLRLYSSPYEVLAGFDVDACTVAYDGKDVFTTCRGHHALLTGYNTIDMSRRSPSYEMRLAKYASRGFAVHVPGYDRDRIDPNVFDKPWNLLHGLAKLTVLEQLQTPQQRHDYMNRQRAKKEAHYGRYLSRRQIERLEKCGGAAEQSNYSTVFLPWGEGHTARRTMKMMKVKDVSLNGKWFAKDRVYRLHPCFFGTADEVLTDMAPDDPPIPEDVPEEKLRPYVRGVMTWLQDDPGRQQIGSFNPITTGDWEAGAYCLPETVNLFVAVNRNDAPAVAAALKGKGKRNPFLRDFLGRSPLHLAVMAGAADVARVLLKKRLTDPALRLPDGRNALHLCAQYNQPGIAEAVVDALRIAAEATSAGKEAPKKKSARVIVFKDVVEQEDNTNAGMRPLHYAVLLRHERVVDVLLKSAAADALAEAKNWEGGRANAWAMLPEPDTAAEEGSVAAIAASLAAHGAATQEALVDADFDTLFHALAKNGKPRVMKAIISALESKSKPLVKKFVTMLNGNLDLPITLAIKHGELACAQVLYSHAKVLKPTQAICDAMRVMAAKYNLDDDTTWSVRRSVESLREADCKEVRSAWICVIEQVVDRIQSAHQRREGRGFTCEWTEMMLGEKGGNLAAKAEDGKDLARHLDVLHWLMREGGVDIKAELTLDDTGLSLSREVEDDEKHTLAEWLEEKCSEMEEEVLRQDHDLSRTSPAVQRFLEGAAPGYETHVREEVLRAKRQVRCAAESLALRESFVRLGAWLDAGGDALPQRAALLEGLDAAGEELEVDAAERDAVEDMANIYEKLKKAIDASFAVLVGKKKWGGMATASVPETARGTVLRAFKAAFDGDVKAIDEALAEDVGSPLVSAVDVFGNTLFLTSLLNVHGHVPALLARLLARAQLEHEPHRPLEFLEGAAPTRFDNFKLLEKVIEKEKDAAMDSEEDDDDDEDGSDCDEEMSEVMSEDSDAAHAKKKHELAHAMGASAKASQMSPAALLCTPGYAPAVMVDPHLPPAWREGQAALALRADVPSTYHITALELAVLQNRADVVTMLLKFLLRYPPGKGEISAAHKHLEETSALRLAVALDRQEIVRAMFTVAGGGAPWQAVATPLGVAAVFKAAAAGDKKCRYRGIASRLEKTRRSGGDEDHKKSRGKKERFTHETVAEMAAFYGATAVLDWALSGGGVAAFSEFLKDSDGALQKALSAFVERVQAAPPAWAVAALPGLAAGSPAAAALAQLTCNHLSGVGAAGTRGVTLIEWAIHGHAVATVEYLLGKDAGLATAQCGLTPAPTGKKGASGAADAAPKRHLPCFVAARAGAVDVLKILLARGANIAETEDGTGRSLLQVILRNGRCPAALCGAVIAARGAEAMKALLQAADAEGVTGYMTVCDNAEHAGIKCLAALCDGVLTDHDLSATGKDGATLLHRAASATGGNRGAGAAPLLRVLGKWAASPLALQEDYTGCTPLDHAVARRETAVHTPFRGHLVADARAERALAPYRGVRDYVFARLRRGTGSDDDDDDDDDVDDMNFDSSYRVEALSRMRPKVLKADDCGTVNGLDLGREDLGKRKYRGKKKKSSKKRRKY